MDLPQQRIDFWGPARREYQGMPRPVIRIADAAIQAAAIGEKASNVKPLHLPRLPGASVMEVVIRHAGSAFRVVYFTAIEDEIWVVRSFMKKSTIGIKTPKVEIDLIQNRVLDLLRAKGLR